MRLFLLTQGLLPLALAIPNVWVLQGPLADELDKPHNLGKSDPAGCLRSCFQEKPACPANMEPRHLGECWSCCLKAQTEQEPGQSANEVHTGLKMEDDTVGERQNCLRRTDRCCIWDGCAWCCSGKNGCSNEPFSGWGYCWG
ncbi:hypothetical protein BDV10DRAFT_177771 [Aspergillus recurvatus]